MLIWPWIFLGAVWAKKGLQMNNHVAKVVRNNPHSTTYIVTLICTFISTFVATIFSLAIIRFAQELVTRYQPIDPFHLTALLSLRHQTLPWTELKKAKDLMKKDKWWPIALVIICILTVPHLVSNIASLITPIPFTRMASLSGTELDFASTDPTCRVWFETHPIPPICDWLVSSVSRLTTPPLTSRRY